MDYYQSVVAEYLRADRAVFLNTEYCIQLNKMPNPDKSGPHWYCDAVALDFRNKVIFLCEISYAKTLSDLVKRLKAWDDNWTGVCDAVLRDSKITEFQWAVQPWLFIPKYLCELLEKRLNNMKRARPLSFEPKITSLEEVQPWHFNAWDRIKEGSLKS